MPPERHDRPADPGHPTDPATFPRRTVLAAGVPAAAAVLGMTAATAPRPAGLGEPQGDQEITSALAEHLRGHRTVSVVLLDPDAEPRFAGFGADPQRRFEIGSVSKTFTGALLADAVDRGELTYETTVADVLGSAAAGSGIADVTLAELASHTAGIPSVATPWLGRAFLSSFLRGDPYATRDAEQVIADALAVSPSDRGEMSYSNHGVALEGLLVAKATGVPYEQLLAERVTEPLGLTSTYAPILSENLHQGAQRGHTRAGLRAAPWTMNGAAPAGGIWSTGADMALYVLAVMDGSGPGGDFSRHLLHEGPDGGRSVAVNWMHDPIDERDPTIWHNGMTGGYAAFVGWHEGTGRGIVMLSDTARSLDAIALQVLTGEVAL
ncbi:beta-lactamase family protein [Brachybacterium muris]|uniref:serine hydrolase domain-containing protein n=1 Tax=Brachybacterium muris TaxID=219301 RepID=UPI0021A377C2|nr:serine hydrolase domain-containing protein [Brachybacterium muris]MCT1997330.1 beta-lactamase family protein [Brachybacterium muris]